MPSELFCTTILVAMHLFQDSLRTSQFSKRNSLSFSGRNILEKYMDFAPNIGFEIDTKCNFFLTCLLNALCMLSITFSLSLNF